jgi:aminoglycoside 3-N-acetyltransferase
MGQREGDVIKRTTVPATVESMGAELRGLGIEPGGVLLVHSSLSEIGWVSGGTVAVILALQAAVGVDEGTLVMPTHSTDLTEPRNWSVPPVPASWCEIIRDTAPAYDPDLTPTRGMGKIPETFRKHKHAIRSAHPHSSFAALGPMATAIVGEHPPPFGLGESSPLARVYELDGQVLLLGVGYSNHTSLHLAEYRATYPRKRTTRDGAPVKVNGKRAWITFEDLDNDAGDFEQIGKDFAAAHPKVVKRGNVGIADCMLMSQRAIVDFGAEWMTSQRS